MATILVIDDELSILHAFRRAFDDPTKPGAKRTYVGRLNGSSWAGFSRHAPLLQRPEAPALTGT